MSRHQFQSARVHKSQSGILCLYSAAHSVWLVQDITELAGGLLGVLKWRGVDVHLLVTAV